MQAGSLPPCHVATDSIRRARKSPSVAKSIFARFFRAKLCLSHLSTQDQCSVELLQPSLRSLQFLPFCGHDSSLCLCTWIQRSFCYLNLANSGGKIRWNRAHSHDASEGTSSCTLALSPVWLLSLFICVILAPSAIIRSYLFPFLPTII